jgi:hypothetical protein
VSPHASGKTSIDFHLLVNGQYIEKRRALEYLFNQGHRQIIFIDNEIFDGGNGASAVDLLRDMNKYPTKYPGKSLRVVSVDPVDMPEKMRGTLGEEEKQIRSFVAAPTPDALRSHGELHSPQLELLSLAGLSETDATAAYLDNTPFGAAAAKKFSPGNEIKVSLSIELHPNEIVGKLIRLNEKGQQEMTLTTHSSHWDPAVSLAPEVFQMVSVLREQAQHTRAQIDSQISVVAGPHFPRKIHANLPLKLEGTAAKGVDFIFRLGIRNQSLLTQNPIRSENSPPRRRSMVSSPPAEPPWRRAIFCWGSARFWRFRWRSSRRPPISDTPGRRRWPEMNNVGLWPKSANGIPTRITSVPQNPSPPFNPNFNDLVSPPTRNPALLD